MTKINSKPKTPFFQRWLATTAVTAISLSGISGAAMAGDHAWVLDQKGGNFDTDTSTPNVTNITQHTSRAIGEGDLDIQTHQIVNIRQNSSGDLFVGRDTKSDPTRILGQLNANGRVMILDENGIFFGRDAVLDVGGLIASTGRISNADIMDGDNSFTFSDFDNGAKIENLGRVNIAEAGLAAFVSPQVINNGVITAKVGKVAFAAGEKVTLDLYGDGLFEIAVNGERADALLQNSGTIAAAGGTVQMTAEAAKDMVDNVINMDGYITARAAEVKGGKIVLSGGEHGKVKVSGNIEADGAKGGGNINITGETVEITNTADISADATNQGDGGLIHIIGNNYAIFRGNLSARGGLLGGDGGFANISGYQGLSFNGITDMSAPNGALGTVFLDPKFLVIHNGLVPIGPAQSYVVAAGSLANNIATANYILQADDFIHVGTQTAPYALVGIGDATFTDTQINDELNTRLNNGDIDLSTWATGGNSGATEGDLTLQSDNIYVNRNLTLGNGNLTINALSGDIAFRANVTMNGGGNITGTAGNNIHTDAGVLVDANGGNISLTPGNAFTTGGPNTLTTSGTGSINVLQTAAGNIQDAVDAINHTGTGDSFVTLTAESFNESVYIDNRVILKGANAGVNPNTDVRGAETVLNGTTWYTVYIDDTADGAGVDGIKFVGNNDDANADYAVLSRGANDVGIENNIFTEMSFGTFFWGDSKPATDGSIIQNNRYFDIDGQAIHVRGSDYADILNNVIYDAFVGVATEFMHQPKPNAGTPLVDGNHITARLIGIRSNLVTSNGTGYQISNNTILADGISETRRWGGIELISHPNSVATTFLNNTIDGSALIGSGRLTSGYEATNLTSPNAVIDGGIVTGVDYGVWASDGNFYTGPVNNLTVQNVAFSNIAKGGILVEDVVDPLNQTGVNATGANVTIGAGNSFTNTPYELVLAGANATAQGEAANSVLVKAAGPAAFTGNPWNTTTTLATENASIQNGIDAVAAGGDVHVDAGLFEENLTLNKQVNLYGAQSGNDPRGGRAGAETIWQSDFSTGSLDANLRKAILSVGADGDDSVVDGFTFNGFVNRNGNTQGLVRIEDGADDVTFSNNIVFTDVNGTAVQTNMPIELWIEGDGATVTRNTFTRSAAALTEADGQSAGNAAVRLGNVTGALVENNIFDGGPVNVAGGSDTIEIKYNLFRNSILKESIETWNTDGDVYIVGNTIEGSSKDGIRVQTSAADSFVYIVGNTIGDASDGVETGITADNHDGTVTIVNNEIYGNSVTGIHLLNAPNALVSGGSVISFETGILIDNSDSSTVFDVDIEDVKDGIWARFSDDLNIQNNTIEDATRYGIRLSHNSDNGSIDGNTIDTARVGIKVESGSNYTDITDNTVFNTTRQGIYTKRDTNSVTGNVVYLTGGNAIEIDDSDGITVADNKIGMNAALAAQGTDNVQGNGLLVTDTRGAKIEDNRVTETTLAGIAYDNSGLGFIRRNIVDNTGGNGIEVTNTQVAVNIADNTVTDVDGSGIYAEGVSNFWIKGNTVTNAALSGIHLKDSHGTNFGPPVTIWGNDTEITQNTLIDSGGNGIFIENSSFVTVGNEFNAAKGNTIIDGRTGVRVEGSDNVWTVNNKISGLRGGSAADGVYLKNAANNIVESNIITDVWDEGIYGRDNLDGTVIKNNRITDTKRGNGIEIIRSTGHVTADGNTVTDAGHFGIAMWNAKSGASYTVENNVVSATDEGGIIVTSDALSVSGNTVFDTGRQGGVDNDAIEVSDSDGVTIADNWIGQNNSGTAQGTDNVRGEGIDVNDSANASITGNEITETTGNGISLNPSPDSLIAHNNLTAIGETGIFVNESKKTDILFNTIDGADTGIHVLRSNRTEINDNVIENTVTAGIFAERSHNGDILRNELNVGKDAILLDRTNRTEIRDNIIKDFSDDGISGRGKWVEITGNQLQTIGDNGITLFNNSDDALIEGNTISGTGDAGIRLSFLSDNGRILDNDIDGTVDGGIELENVTGTYVQGNRIGLNGLTDGSGITLVETTDTTLEENEIENALVAGINAEDSDQIDILYNTLTDNRTGALLAGDSIGSVRLLGNVLNNNSTGMEIQSGLIDLTSPIANEINGGSTGLRFNRANGTAPLELVNNNLTPNTDGTIGYTRFSGQALYYVEFTNNAFSLGLNNPQDIDATFATYDGFTPDSRPRNGAGVPVLTPLQYAALENGIYHYADDTRQGRVLFGTLPPELLDGLNLNQQTFLQQQSNQGEGQNGFGVTVNGLPLIPGLNNLAGALNQIQPAAGGEGTEGETSPEDLAGIEPAAGGTLEGGTSVESACWSDAYGMAQQGQSVTINYGAGAAALDSAANCANGDI